MLPINDSKFVKPKFLRQLPERGYNGKPHIFPYSDDLAMRDDMVAHWPDGKDPNVQGTPGLASAGTDPAVLAEIEALRRDNEDMRKQNEQLSRQVQKLAGNADESGLPSAEDRHAKIRSVVAQINAENNPEDFTSAGHPRIESVQDRCGFEVSRAEINRAIQG
jgi:hypothetical protein